MSYYCTMCRADHFGPEDKPIVRKKGYRLRFWSDEVEGEVSFKGEFAEERAVDEMARLLSLHMDYRVTIEEFEY